MSSRIWAMAAMCRTWFNRRFPARDSRCRICSPEEASRGAVPVQDAKWLRSGNRAMSPTSARILAAPAGPMPCRSIRCEPRAWTAVLSSLIRVSVWRRWRPGRPAPRPPSAGLSCPRGIWARVEPSGDGTKTAAQDPDSSAASAGMRTRRLTLWVTRASWRTSSGPFADAATGGDPAHRGAPDNVDGQAWEADTRATDQFLDDDPHDYRRYGPVQGGSSSRQRCITG